MDRDKISILYREPSIDASYQVSVHLAKRFQRRIFKNQPIRNKNCLWRPCLLMDRDEMSNRNRGLSINASYHVSVHLAKRFQRRRILKNQKQESPVMAMFVNGSGRNEQSLQRTIHRCFLPSFGSFGQAVSEENIFRNQPIRNKNGLWWPCLLTDWNEMSNLYKGPSIDASYQVSVHLAKQFQRRRFLKIGQSETRIACGGHVC
jgi:hypothetical protein